MKKFKRKVKKAIDETKKSTLIVYFVLRLLVLLTFIRQLWIGSWDNAFICLLCLILFLVPFFIEKKFKVTIPNTLEIIILCFIFAAEILGEINNFYVHINHFDTILHTINGFLCAAGGFALIDLLNEKVASVKLSPIFVSIVAFCFSMTIGVLWEFFEYAADNFLGYDMQKDKIVYTISTVELDETKSNTVMVVDNIDKTVIYDKNGAELANFHGYLDIGLHDTMKDLLVNFLGAIFFSAFGFLYILNREKYKFVDNFLITRKLNIIKESDDNE